MEILALIPARGGSKSILHKNLIMVAGKPLVAWSIEHAKQAKCVTRIIVSTDDDNIARVARDYGAEVIERPAEFATDTSPDLSTFYHALKHLWSAEGYMPQLVVHLRPTMPLRLEGDIDRAIGMLLADPKATSIRSVSVAKQSPYKMWCGPSNGYITPFYNDDDRDALLQAKIGNNHGKPAYIKWAGEQHSLPRQLLPQFLHQNGYIDVIRAKTILDDRKMAGDYVLPFYVNDLPDDLDYLSDLPALELAMRATQGEKQYAT
jgi:CMP-N,N'-diacetyllegionaminic acid synthase